MTQNHYMSPKSRDAGAMVTRVGDAVPDDVLYALQDIAQGSRKPDVTVPARERRLPGMLTLEPQKLATAAARMNRRRLDQTRTTLHNALELAVAEHGDSLTADEILDIVRRADSLLDILLARERELEQLEREKERTAELQARRDERQRAKQKKAAKKKSTRDMRGARRAGRERRVKIELASPRMSPPQPRMPGKTVSQLYAQLDHLKLQVRPMDATQKNALRRQIAAELEKERTGGRTFVRPDSTLKIKANAVLAVLDDGNPSTTKTWKSPSAAPAPLRSRQMIYRGRGRVVSGGLPGLGRR